MTAIIPLAVLGRADSHLEREAREALTWKLLTGGRVQGIDLHDLLDSALNGVNSYPFILPKIYELLTAEHGEHGAKADEINAWLIERHLESMQGQIAIEDEMAEIELADRGEP